MSSVSETLYGDGFSIGNKEQGKSYGLEQLQKTAGYGV